MIKPIHQSADSWGMALESRVMLFSPPLQPVEVLADAPVVIGRQAQCDITLPHTDVSRQHAEVCFEGGNYLLRDLGSTNGTFLNGKETRGPTTLSPGDRIEMGSRVVTFCQLAPESMAAPDPALEADCTVIAQRFPTTSDAFVGDLGEIPPYAVLQVLEMGDKTGILEIEGESLTCRIWFQRGVPVHAESGKQSGFDAAMSAVTLESGRFCFDATDFEIEATLACTVSELLLEGFRQLDESNA